MNLFDVFEPASQSASFCICLCMRRQCRYNAWRMIYESVCILHSCMYYVWCMYECIIMYVCVCMYAYMHACMHACMYVYVCVCMYVCLHVCMCVCVYVCMYVCMYVRTCTSMSCMQHVLYIHHACIMWGMPGCISCVLFDVHAVGEWFHACMFCVCVCSKNPVSHNVYII